MIFSIRLLTLHLQERPEAHFKGRVRTDVENYVVSLKFLVRLSKCSLLQLPDSVERQSSDAAAPIHARNGTLRKCLLHLKTSEEVISLQQTLQATTTTNKKVLRRSIFCRALLKTAPSSQAARRVCRTAEVLCYASIRNRKPPCDSGCT